MSLHTLSVVTLFAYTDRSRQRGAIMISANPHRFVTSNILRDTSEKQIKNAKKFLTLNKTEYVAKTIGSQQIYERIAYNTAHENEIDGLRLI